MNEPKSSRYHRLNRRAGLASLAITAVLLAALLEIRLPLAVLPYAALLALLHELATFPVSLYRYSLERRYELSSQPFQAWLKDHVKGSAIGVVFAAAFASTVYLLIARTPEWWWLITAVLGAGLTMLLAVLAPVALLPIFYRFTPLDRPELSQRLLDLSRRAGVRVLGVYVWGLGTKTKRANAALVGVGATRRILLSDTMLAEYSDDEIEVILAHELAHHAHRDIPKAILLEFLLLLAGGYAAALVLNAFWLALGLRGPSDPAGLPLLALVAGAVTLAATPVINAFSRANERRADAFALDLTSRRDAFVTAMRRLGAQNLAEENPSRTSVWLFHTHPPVEERIMSAMRDA